jgi:hypothetical protein
MFHEYKPRKGIVDLGQYFPTRAPRRGLLLVTCRACNQAWFSLAVLHLFLIKSFNGSVCSLEISYPPINQAGCKSIEVEMEEVRLWD